MPPPLPSSRPPPPPPLPRPHPAPPPPCPAASLQMSEMHSSRQEEGVLLTFSVADCIARLRTTTKVRQSSIRLQERFKMVETGSKTCADSKAKVCGSSKGLIPTRSKPRTW
ncbi:Os08g0119400 [Oryza sativa Japonica Group]|uniref:Os08g0119400 protein n=1 Tax=Oryza sativa subsp. japonica TaxID=39947 RepID=A0A0P0XBD6_ORYSJ|nr:Os08g0119400 [Oryza sativa Japonica Group]